MVILAFLQRIRQLFLTVDVLVAIVQIL